jgi:BirA family transcriptional regulator, biotin operon repressor / biotin---[acetyl-CoA-carboxylase] ligase
MKIKSTNKIPLHPLNTLFVGRVFHDLPEVDSTNAHALSLLSKSKPPEGTVISTRVQYAGRGQIGGGWESAHCKNITLSVILYPVFLPAPRQFQLNQAISLALCEFVAAQIPTPVTIKWPNDIYAGDRKIGGVLIQNAVSGSRLKSSVVGIGLNINQEVFLTHPPNPTSFKLETGAGFDIGALLPSLFRQIEAGYLKLKSGKTVPLQQQYLQRLYRFGEPAIFQRKNDKFFQGVITDVSASGKLEITMEGKSEEFDLKEIKFIQNR